MQRQRHRAAPSPGETGPVLGIDLGTTMSAVAYLEDGNRPVLIENDLGDLLTPSTVCFQLDERGNLEELLGEPAVDMAVSAPAEFAECFKRDMGGELSGAQVCGLWIPPEVLSALILERLCDDARRKLGKDVRRAVITVPAFFDELCRKATQDAGRLAGLEVLDIINEPTAAAVYYAHSHGGLKRPGAAEGDHNLFVYDLGGGTFDVTVLRAESGTFRVLATGGNLGLGGHEFDQRLADHVAKEFRTATHYDPNDDPADRAQLLQDAREMKERLSGITQVRKGVTYGGRRHTLHVTRSQFEGLTQDLLQQTENTAQLVLGEANLTWQDIHRVILVGGSTRMPMVPSMLQRISNRQPDRSMNPDQAVASGAAIYAASLSGGEVELVNVNSHSLAVCATDRKTGRRRNVIFIKKNSPLPARGQRVFDLRGPDQRSVSVPVYEGESDDPLDCKFLGKCIVPDLPPGLPQKTPVKVTFEYGSDGRLTVGAAVAGVAQKVQLERPTDRDLEDLATWRARIHDALRGS